MTRVKLIFDKNLLHTKGDDEWRDAMRKCWFVIPHGAESVSDLHNHMLQQFSYMLKSKIRSLTLYMDGFSVPLSQPVKGLLRDDDTIRIKKGFSSVTEEKVDESDTKIAEVECEQEIAITPEKPKHNKRKRKRKELAQHTDEDSIEQPSKEQRMDTEEEDENKSQKQVEVQTPTVETRKDVSVSPTQEVKDRKRDAIAHSWGFSNWNKKQFQESPKPRITNPLASKQEQKTLPSTPTSTVPTPKQSTPSKALTLRSGDTILYKILELSESMVPQISQEYEARIVGMETEAHTSKLVYSLLHDGDEEPIEAYASDLLQVKKV